MGSASVRRRTRFSVAMAEVAARFMQDSVSPVANAELGQTLNPRLGLCLSVAQRHEQTL